MMEGLATYQEDYLISEVTSPSDYQLKTVSVEPCSDLYCLTVRAGFYSDMAKCLPFDAEAQGLIPWSGCDFSCLVTISGQYGG